MKKLVQGKWDQMKHIHAFISELDDNWQKLTDWEIKMK
jgi:hypothetical protein